MSETMQRCQILLPPELRRRLAHLARSERRTVSDITRQAIVAGLDEMEKYSEVDYRKQKAALLELKRLRHQTREKYGVYQGDPVKDARDERQKEIDRVVFDHLEK